MALGKIIATAAFLIISCSANAQFHFSAEADFTEESRIFYKAFNSLLKIPIISKSFDKLNNLLALQN